LDQLLEWADYLVVAQKQTDESAKRIQDSGIPVMGLVDGSFESSPRMRTLGAVS
jgi:hypothetical protein